MELVIDLLGGQKPVEVILTIWKSWIQSPKVIFGTCEIIKLYFQGIKNMNKELVPLGTFTVLSELSITVLYVDLESFNSYGNKCDAKERL